MTDKQPIYAELPPSVDEYRYGGGLFTEAQIRTFADATHALRVALAAPQQAAPAVASKAVLAAIRDANLQLVRTGEDTFMLVTLKQAAPQQEVQYDHGPQAEAVAEAARDVGKWLNERPNRPLDLRHVAMLAHHATAQPAPSGDAEQTYAQRHSTAKPASVVDKRTKLQMTAEVLRRMDQQEDGHNSNPFRPLLERLMRNEGGYSTTEIGQLKYALDGFYGAARKEANKP